MDYSPDTLAAQLVAGAGDVLPWVGAGVAGGLTLLFAFLGIRAGFRFFLEVSGAGKNPYWSASDESAWQDDFGASSSERSEADFRNKTGEHHSALPFDFV